MNREDRHLIRFVMTWEPYDEAAAGELFVTFGMTPDRYLPRLRLPRRVRA
ncbi:hypothetical protein BDB13_6431 [Rhodococcus sp. OK302]|nr:hypothetical protein BDB13_6431 [Rhodococcus sp. OK302]